MNTYDQLDDRVVKSFILHTSRLFDQIEQITDELVIKYLFTLMSMAVRILDDLSTYLDPKPRISAHGRPHKADLQPIVSNLLLWVMTLFSTMSGLLPRDQSLARYVPSIKG